MARPRPNGIAVLAALALLAPALAAGKLPTDDSLAALHWYPQTGAHARALSGAVALYLAETGAVDENWAETVEARRLLIRRLVQRQPPEMTVKVDGRFGDLVLAGEISRLGEAAVEPAEAMARPDPFRPLPDDDTAPARAARLVQAAALDPRRVWSELMARLESAGLPAALPDRWWGPSMAAWEQSAKSDPAGRAYALAQAARTRALAAADDRHARSGLLEVQLAAAEWNWENGRLLTATWQLLDGIYRALDEPPEAARRVAEMIEGLMPDDPAALRRIDPALPVVLALIKDSADELAAGGNRLWARTEIAHAYSRLALFLPDADFYLDQPVRQEIIEGLGQCVSPGMDGEPVARSTYEACLTSLFGLLASELDTDELTGGGAGPFAAEFLEREMELATWQRVDYLAGHLDWMLAADCQLSSLINVLEWSLLTELLGRWVPLRPVYIGTGRWQESVDRALRVGLEALDTQAARLECLSDRAAGRGSQGLMEHLFTAHRLLLSELDTALSDAIEQFRADYLKPGADVNLETGSLGVQSTAYRPEDLMVTACDPATSCGARVALPVSRTLIGLFPNAFLLADQLRMGEISVCYDQVRWVNRRQAPARPRDPNVANYHGHFSFDLVGRFTGNEARPEEIFRLRLTDDTERQYLFSSSDPEILELDCPVELIGEPVASELTDERLPLVPRRLTYFSSTAVSPDRLLTANWERGAEWRDWFLAGERVEKIHRREDPALLAEVNLRLEELSGRRERLLTWRMLRQPAVHESDPLTLAAGALSGSVALMRRAAEMFYPVQIRHDQELRASLVGASGLLERDRLRWLRESGAPLSETAAIGLARLAALEGYWGELPQTLRGRGQAIPELVHGIEQLRGLEQLSQPEPASGGAPEDQ